MADLSGSQSAQFVKLTGGDELHAADVILDQGVRKLATDTTVTVEEVLGQDPLPDSYFTIINAGAIGDTIRLQIAGTAGDTSSPDRDLPAVDFTYTLVAADVGDEIKLRDNFIIAVNANATFQSAKLKAQAPGGDFRAVVHITSTEFSMQNEILERPNANDFQVTTTGTTTVNIAFDTLISRGKPTSLARDPDNPHRLGILGISGSVLVNPGSIGNLYINTAQNGGSSNLLVDGSVTPVNFTINANGADTDIFIQEMRFYAQGNGIKFGQFLSKNVILTNGIQVMIIADNADATITLPLYKVTENFKNKFAFGSGANFRIDVQAGADEMLAVFILENPFPLRAGSSDKVEVKIQDNITSGINKLEFLVRGFEKEA